MKTGMMTCKSSPVELRGRKLVDPIISSFVGRVKYGYWVLNERSEEITGVPLQSAQHRRLQPIRSGIGPYHPPEADLQATDRSDRVRVKAETFKVGEPEKAMGRFESLLGKLVKVPKGEIKDKRKQVKPPPEGKPKG